MLESVLVQHVAGSQVLCLVCLVLGVLSGAVYWGPVLSDAESWPVAPSHSFFVGSFFRCHPQKPAAV